MDAAFHRSRRTTPTLMSLAILALAVQTAGMGAVTILRGSPAAYAFQSPDAAEYLALARGLAWKGTFQRLDARGTPVSGPDVWRTPGYPAFLAVAIRLVGDDPLRLLVIQQLLAAACVPLAYLVFRRFTANRWAVWTAVAWAFDPFRVYYSLWLLAGTLFVFILLWIVHAWARNHAAGWTPRQAAWLGLLTGAAVLVRPIGILLPPLAWLSVLAATRKEGRTRAAVTTLACCLGTAGTVTPWLVRNHRVTGHVTLTCQSGASFAYHKVVDVILHEQGRADHRFDPHTLDAVRRQIDERLRTRWQERFGPLSPAQREALSWHKLNFGIVEADIDPALASSMLWSVGLEMIADRKRALVECFLAQGAGLLAFPLGLVLFPPAGRTAPFSMLLGTAGSKVALAVSLILGAAYTALAAAVLVRLAVAVVRRSWPPCMHLFWPFAGLLCLTFPFEDPRFRLPLVPLMWIMVVGRAKGREESRVSSSPRLR